jgi:pyruvate,water dikinase
MADMKEKLSGEYLFDRHYINTNIEHIADAVLGIIECLDKLSGGKYKRLYNQYNGINKAINKILSAHMEIPVSDLTIPLENIKGDMSAVAGGKIAHLGEIKNSLNFPVPDGFSITAHAFKRFMEHSMLSEKINGMLRGMNISSMEAINETSRKIQDIVIGAEIPEDLRNAINKAVESLKLKVQSSPTLNPPLIRGGMGGNGLCEKQRCTGRR